MVQKYANRSALVLTLLLAIFLNVQAQTIVTPVAGVATVDIGTCGQGGPSPNPSCTFKLTLTANTTLAFNNVFGGANVNLFINPGGFILTWPASVPIPAPVLTAGQNNSISLRYDGTTGTWLVTSGGAGGLLVASISTYGAISASTTNDGAMATSSGTFLATGSSTTPATPAGTTTFNNETVFVAYAFFNSFTAPGSPTQRVNIAGSPGNFDGLYMGDISVASSGAYSAFTGSQASGSWTALAIPMIPTTGQTISVTGAATSNTAGSGSTSVTVNKPTGISAGGTLIACLSPSSPTMFGGWSKFASGGSAPLNCYARTATASEPSSYTFTFGNGGTGNMVAAIVGYNNVAAFDNTVTSATMGFTPSSVGKELCISTPNFGVLACSPIGLYSSATTVYPLFANTTSSALSGQMLIQGIDSTSAFTTANAALTSGGGTLGIPPGTFFLTSGNMTIPYNQGIMISGSGATTPVYFNGGSSIYYVPLNPRGSTVIGIGDLNNDPLFFWPNSPVTNQYGLGQYSLEKVTLLGDGSGGNGLTVRSSHIIIRQNVINGFGQDGVLFSVTANGLGQGYAGNAIMEENTVSGNHFGIEITGAPAQMEFRNNEVDNNSVALQIQASGLNNTVFQGNVFQWGSGSCEVTITGSTEGVSFTGNWLEGGGFCFTAPTGSKGPVITGNHINNTNELNLTNNITGMLFLGNSGGSSANWISGAGTLQNATVDSTNAAIGGSTSPFRIAFTGTSGTASCAYADHGGQVTIACFMNGYAQTGAAQTWTFPLPLATTPLNSTAQTSCGSFNPSATSTILTMPANAGMTAETCQFTLQGQTN